MFHVKKRIILMITGILWLIAGFNVARLGVLSYYVIESKWYLYILMIVVFSIFGMMFFKMSKNTQNELWNMKQHVPSGTSLI